MLHGFQVYAKFHTVDSTSPGWTNAIVLEKPQMEICESWHNCLCQYFQSFDCEIIILFVFMASKYIILLESQKKSYRKLTYFLWRPLPVISQAQTYCQISNIRESYNRSSFWKFFWEKAKTLGASYIGVFHGSQCEIRSTPSEFLTVSDNKGSCGRTIFQAIRAIKTSKTSSLLDHNIVLEIMNNRIWWLYKSTLVE